MVRSLAILVLAGTAMTSVAAAGSVLVVRSSGPSAKAYPAGKAIADAQTISLKSNDMLVLLDSRGTRTLRGPGSFSASASASPSASSMAAAAQGGNRRVRIQAVRGAPTGATQGRNIWQADISRSGNVCVASPADLGLYRANAASEAHVTLRDAAGASATVHFNAGQSIAPWPQSLPVAAGAKYKVAGAALSPTTLEVHMLSPVPAGLEGMAQSFIRNGCQGQLDVLIDTFTSPSAS
ncbi:hypothetical protein H9L12_07325 [Sphingomonas rhizophila]|uniref:DUF4397 domain-containing protein n=1 Tax=Sphingomonas rhizophila TaxID=2071607 RepID=A0A7G9S8L4_9SPHN|nr:hypothetical protein [Sphingomonas rhizophila]QNN64189.1 hypothetical protein H9L12_07325 [Sphingomonas rhizophila]